jgi:lauroyl/myristoyl acyltransferase
LWILLIVLDMLPWPWGEEILAGVFMIGGLARPSRRRSALAWAEAQGTAHPWRLAAEVCAFLGRWVAQMRALGLRRPEDLRNNLVVEGREHLTAVPGGAILLGFHLGPGGGGDMTFRVLGYPVTFFGWNDRAATLGWWSDEWRPFVEPDPLSFAAGRRERWLAALYTARDILLKGGKVHLLADGDGREVFRLPLSVGELSIGAGWLTLHQLTGAPVLPVVRRLEGRRHVMTIHPPLPTLASTSQESLEAWRGRLTRLVEDYVRRFPEQCPHLALVLRMAGPRPAGASP